MDQITVGRVVEIATHGGGTLAIDGTTGIILLAPIEASITEVEGQGVVEENSVATPASVMVEALQDPSAMPIAPRRQPGST